MATIIRGTTPTITFTFSDISVLTIEAAYMTLKQCGDIVVEKTLSDATQGENSLSWKLTQEDTLKLSSQTGIIVCDWLLSDGTRGRSGVMQFDIGEPAINGVIPTDGD